MDVKLLWTTYFTSKQHRHYLCHRGQGRELELRNAVSFNVIYKYFVMG
jgi:hypothetical protein